MWTIERKVADGWELIEDRHDRLIAWNDMENAVSYLSRLEKANTGLNYRIAKVGSDYEDFRVMD